MNALFPVASYKKTLFAPQKACLPAELFASHGDGSVLAGFLGESSVDVIHPGWVGPGVQAHPA